MATFKTCILAHHKKADGTYSIKLRITHHRRSRWINTNLLARPEDLTRSLKLKNEILNRKCRELTDACIDICSSLGYAVESMDVDELVAHIKAGLNGSNHFRLDFVAYMYRAAEKMNRGTGSIYRTAANALKRYAGRESIDIQEINNGFIRGFIQFLETEPSQRGANRKSKTESTMESKGNRALSLYLSRIKTIWNQAKDEFNDEELGIIPIKGNPFKTIRIKTPPPTDKRALPARIIQQIIDLPPFDQEQIQRARDCFLLSFALMGMNSVDMLMCGKPSNDEIIYNRQKTASRRFDHAEMHVRIEPCIAKLIERYSDKTGRRLFNFYLKYSDGENFNKMLNKGLKEVGKAVGVPDLTFYAARHSMATIARTPETTNKDKNQNIGGAGLDKYMVHEMLNHVDPAMKVTDIYLVKDWNILWDANKKLLSLFDWANL